MEPGFQAFLREQLLIAKMSLNVLDPKKSMIWNIIVKKWERMTPVQKNMYIKKTMLIE